MPQTVEFEFAVGERVEFRGNNRVQGEVLGAMVDANGQHFEVRFSVGEKSRRRWFNGDSLIAMPAGPSGSLPDARLHSEPARI